MSLVVDASVAVKWFLPEDRSAEARAISGQGEDLTTPATALLEIYHALWKAARRGEPVDLAAVPSLLRSAFAHVAPVEPLFAPAAELASTLSHPIYDCIYLALAMREDTAFITADERLFAAARRARVQVRLL
jgi:predicted nucleic acid-binding protein